MHAAAMLLAGPLSKAPAFAQQKATPLTAMASTESQVFREEDTWRALG
jgi:hypothetical protein